MDKSRSHSRKQKATGVSKGDRVPKLTHTRVKDGFPKRKLEGAVGRFSDSTAIKYYPFANGPVGKRQRSGRIRAHPVPVVLRVLNLCYEIGIAKTARMMGVPLETVKTWYYYRFLPKTGAHTFDKMLRLVGVARRLYQTTPHGAMTCLKKATDQLPNMKWGEVKLYVYFQAMPTVPGFPMYADRMANEKAERYGLGLRRYSAVLGVEPPHIQAEVQCSKDDQPRTGRRVVPAQRNRKFVVEGRVTSPIPLQKRDLL